MKYIVEKLAPLVISLALILGVSACDYAPGAMPAAKQSTAGGTGSTCGTALNCYQTGFYAFALKANCVSCHGQGQTPLFAVPDVSEAMANAAAYWNTFSDPSASPFILHATDGHCANASICGVASNKAVVTTDITQWANAELSPSGNPSSTPSSGPTSNPTGAVYFTAAAPIPAPSSLPQLLAKTTPYLLRIPLSTITYGSGVAAPPAGYATGILELQVQAADSDLIDYRISNPRIEGNSAALSLSGIHIYIASQGSTTIGFENVPQGSLWDTLSPAVAVAADAFTAGNAEPNATTPFKSTVINTEGLNLPVGTTGLDQLVIGFDSF